MPEPTTPVLYSFAGSDTSPDPNFTNFTGSVIRRLSNTGAASAGQTLGYYTTSGPFAAGNCEVFMTVPTKPGTLGAVSVMLLEDLTSIATIDGYEGRVTVASGGGNDTFAIYRIDNGAGTLLASATQEINNGDGMWLHNRNGLLTLYYKSGAGAWTQIVQTTDTTYLTNTKRLGFFLSSTAPRIDDIGGGSIKAPPAFLNRSLYRWNRRY